MSKLIIRRATPDDASKVALLTRKAMLTYRDASGISGNVLESLTETDESVRARIEAGRCLCVFQKDEVVGTITITRCKNPIRYSFSEKTEQFLSQYSSCGYISRFAVKDELRKSGLGGKLMDAALASRECTETGLVLLHTAIANKGMKIFYYNRGFDLIDSESSRGYERGLFAYERPFIESDIQE